jgi:ADP-heptose:LPS heptosyltransferase
MTKDKIFMLTDGGAGRILCSIPALEHYALTHDNFHIITYSDIKSNFFVGNTILEKHTHNMDDEDLFTNIVKDGEVIKLEPYYRSEYFNQECSLAQAFDLEINGKHSIGNKTPKIYFNPSENTKSKNFIEALKHEYKKDKVLVLQPYGQSAQVFPDGIFDETNRSFTMEDVITIASRLRKDYIILFMGHLRLNISNVINGVNINDNSIIYLDATLRDWAGYIKFADHFLGCDSVGQHLAKSVNQNATVVIGASSPICISYPNDDKFTVFDLGKERRVYEPYRVTIDKKAIDANKGIMKMDDETIDKIIDNIVKIS